MPAPTRRSVYKNAFGRARPQALWIIPEAYRHPAGPRRRPRLHRSRALEARKTPMLTIYGIPDRDCGGHSSAGCPQTAAAYRGWIRAGRQGAPRTRTPLVILEPDALPFFGSDAAVRPTRAAGSGCSRFASRTLSESGAWVYLDAGALRLDAVRQPAARCCKKAGIQVRPRLQHQRLELPLRPPPRRRTPATLLRGLRTLGVKGKRYVVDTSRNGASDPVERRRPQPDLGPRRQAPEAGLPGRLRRHACGSSTPASPTARSTAATRRASGATCSPTGCSAVRPTNRPARSDLDGDVRGQPGRRRPRAAR